MNVNAYASVLMGGAAALLCLSSAAAEAVDDAHSVIETVTVTGLKIADVDKGQTPLIETPQNIQFVSSALLIDTDTTRLDEALRNVAGVMGGGTYANWDYFRIRGFDASGYLYQDGLKLDSGVRLNTELFGIEQIEVVKGPASSLYGQGSPGGMINLASKRPGAENFLNLAASYGEYGGYSLSADGNRALSDTVGGRLAALWRHEGSFIDHADSDRLYLAPSLRWQIDEATSLIVLGSYQHDNLHVAFPLTALGTITPSAFGTYAADTYTGEPGRSNRANSNREQIGYEFARRLDEVFAVQSRLRYAWNGQSWDHMLYNSHLSADGRTLYRYPYSYADSWTDFSADESISAKFRTGPIAHTLVVGADHFVYRDRGVSRQIDYGDPASYMPLDLYDPVYGTAMTALVARAVSIERTDDTGLYLQEHAKWGAFGLTVGLRYDFTRFANSWNGDLAPHDNEAFVPRVGLTYDLTAGSTLFASYSESFLPQSGSTFEGRAVDPEAGVQWEAGIKSNLWDDRISFTASLFRLIRSHVATADPAHANFVIETGKVRSQGFEFDGRATPLPGWDIIATYAYIDAAVTADSVYPVGDHPQGAPQNSLGFWSKYAFPAGPLHGWSVNAGVYHYSSQTGDLPNTFRLPAYSLVNAGLAYDFGPAEIQLTVKNLLDETYYAGSYNALYVQPGTPRTVGVDLRLAL